MASNTTNPAPRGDADDRDRNAISCQAIGSENITHPTTLQHLRARVIARRCGIKPSLAYAVALLAFGGEGRA